MENEKNIGRGILIKLKQRPKLLKTLIVILAALLLIFGAYLIGKNSNSEPDYQEKVTEISLKNIGELSTQEAYITVVEAMNDSRKFFDFGIPFTKSICIFSHDFVVKAGYQFDEIIPIVEEGIAGKKGTITIHLPEAQILDISMCPDKEVVYYENESIFKNIDEQSKADIRTQMGVKAENTAIENGILDSAKENAKKLLTNFIYNLYSPDEYEIIFVDEESK